MKTTYHFNNEYKKVKYNLSGTPKNYSYYLIGDKNQSFLPPTVLTIDEARKEVEKIITMQIKNPDF